MNSCAISVAPMNVPALAANDTTTMRQPSRRNAGTSFAIDSPANARRADRDRRSDVRSGVE
jgi:hypothetical protein